MKSKVIPFSLTQVDAQAIARASNDYLERNVVRAVDSDRIDPRTPKGILSILEHWSGPAPNPFNDSRDHIHLGFAVFADDEDLVLDLCRFIRVPAKVSKEGTAVIFTASLNDWKEILTTTSSIVKSRTFDYTEIRSVLNCIQGFLEQAGFSDVFIDFRKQPLSDGTYILSEK